MTCIDRKVLESTDSQILPGALHFSFLLLVCAWYNAQVLLIIHSLIHSLIFRGETSLLKGK